MAALTLDTTHLEVSPSRLNPPKKLCPPFSDQLRAASRLSIGLLNPKCLEALAMIWLSIFSNIGRKTCGWFGYQPRKASWAQLCVRSPLDEKSKRSSKHCWSGGHFAVVTFCSNWTFCVALALQEGCRVLPQCQTMPCSGSGSCTKHRLEKPQQS